MKYLGIDYGKRKIGLAISEGLIAQAKGILKVKGLEDATKKIQKIIQEESIEAVVIGVPEGKSKNTVNTFINSFKKNLAGVKIIKSDETLTSVYAKNLMISLNIPKLRRRKEDAYSAALILQNFLDNKSVNEK